LLIAGAFGGATWFLRHYTRGEPSEIDEALWNGEGWLSLPRYLGTSVISQVVIGMGASIGREAGHRVLGDRDRHGLDIPARSRHLLRHPRLPVHLAGDDLGAAGRAGHRAGLGRLHPAHRLGLASCHPSGQRDSAG
jgi:hypothetical protein